VSNSYREDHGNIHLDYETVTAMEVVIKLIKVDPREMDDMQRGNAFRRPEDDEYYRVEFLTSEGEVVATNKNTSSEIWQSVYYGVLKDGDKLAIEMETCAHVLPEKPEEDNWVSIAGEAMCVLYTRVKFDQDKKAQFHKAINLIRIGSDEYFRNFGGSVDDRKPSYENWLKNKE